MATLQRNRHSPPRTTNEPSQALVANLDYFSSLPSIEGPKPWTDDVERAAVYHCLQSSPPIMALCAAGVPHATAGDWMSDSPPESYKRACHALAGRLKQAEQACASELFGLIKRAAQDPRYWTAAAWTLERKHGYVAQQQGLTGPATVVNIGQLVVNNVSPGDVPRLSWRDDPGAIEAQSVAVESSTSK